MEEPIFAAIRQAIDEGDTEVLSRAVTAVLRASDYGCSSEEVLALLISTAIRTLAPKPGPIGRKGMARRLSLRTQSGSSLTAISRRRGLILLAASEIRNRPASGMFAAAGAGRLPSVSRASIPAAR